MEAPEVDTKALGCLIVGILLAVLVAGFASSYVIRNTTEGERFNAGVIAAARGTHVAELVEQGDGTSEWRVREVEK